MLPVAGDLLAEIEYAVIGVVVEEAQRTAFVFVDADIERDVLVHGVAGLRIVADGVLRAHAQTPELLIQMPRLFAEAVEMVFLAVHTGVVAEPAEMIFLESPLRQITVEAIAFFVIKSESKGLPDKNELQRCSLKTEHIPTFGAIDIQSPDPLPLPRKKGIKTVRPGCGDKGIGCLIEPAIEVHADADYVIREKDDQHVRRVGMQQPAVVRFFIGLQFVYQHYGTPFACRSGQSTQR